MELRRNPWKKTASRKIYANPWLTLREDQVIHPNGEPGIYAVIDTRIATGAVALTPRREVYLVGQYRYPLDTYSWEVPEGGAEAGEDPLRAIQRELAEETGLRAERWVQLGGPLHLSNCISSEVGYVFLAEELRGTAAKPDDHEVLEVKKVPFEEALAMCDRGEITDAITCIALMRADRYLRGAAC